MAVTQYVGARYVPLFAQPLEWSNTREYEPLTIVTYQGNSYTSRQAVPRNIDINNEDFWALSANYNAQVEQYRQEVNSFDERISDNTNNISDINLILPKTDFNSTNTVKKYIDDRVTEKDILLIIGDSWAVLGEQVARGDWVTPLTTLMDCDTRNYAVGGQGYVNGANNFVVQLTKAVSELTSAEKLRVKWVLIQGLVNDVNHNVAFTDILTNLNAMSTTINTEFPHAAIYLAPNMPGLERVSAEGGGFNVARRCYEYAMQLKNNEMLNDCFRYVLPTYKVSFGVLDSEIYTSQDMLHLNATGAKLYKKIIYSGLKNGNMQPNRMLAAWVGGASYDLFKSENNEILIRGNYMLKDGIAIINSLRVSGNATTGSYTLIPQNETINKLFKHFLIGYNTIRFYSAAGVDTGFWTMRAENPVYEVRAATLQVGYALPVSIHL